MFGTIFLIGLAAAGYCFLVVLVEQRAPAQLERLPGFVATPFLLSGLLAFVVALACGAILVLGSLAGVFGPSGSVGDYYRMSVY